MAMIKCPECGSEISDNAPKCIKCGCPIKRKKDKNGIIIITLAIISVLALIAVTTVVVVLSNKDKTANVDNANEDVNGVGFADEGLDEKCYSEVLELIDYYRSEDFNKQILEIYKDYKTKSYNSDVVKVQIADLKYGMKSQYVKVYDAYEDDGNRKMILFGYNYSLLFIDQLRAEAMRVTNVVDNRELLDKYYPLFKDDPSIELFDRFQIDYPDNYAKELKMATRADVAFNVKVYTDLFKFNYALSNDSLEKRKFTEASDYFSKACESLKEAMNYVEKYPDYKKDFVAGDTSKAKEALKNLPNYYKNFMDAAAINSVSTMQTYSSKIEKEFDYAYDLYEELEKNAEKYMED